MSYSETFKRLRRLDKLTFELGINPSGGYQDEDCPTEEELETGKDLEDLCLSKITSGILQKPLEEKLF